MAPLAGVVSGKRSSTCAAKGAGEGGENSAQISRSNVVEHYHLRSGQIAVNIALSPGATFSCGQMAQPSQPNNRANLPQVYPLNRVCLSHSPASSQQRNDSTQEQNTPPQQKQSVRVSQQQRQKPPAQTQPAVKVFDVPRGDISTTEEAGAGGLGGDAVCVGAGGGGGVSATAAADAAAPPAVVCASSVELGLFFEPLRCCLRTQRRWLPNARVASMPCTNHMAMGPRDPALLSKKKYTTAGAGFAGNRL